MYHTDDTIAAIATASGEGARGIIRLSGLEVVRTLKGCFQSSGGADLAEIAEPCVVEGTLQLPQWPGGHMPCDLYLWPDRRSYTRQPCAELHTVNSAPLLAVALDALCAAGARLAEPGEFTLRAFLAGRLDLTQAEAVLGIVDAGGRRDFAAALAQLAGGLGQPLQALRGALLDLLAELEAGLDFVEEDIAFITPGELDARLAQAAEIVQRTAEQMDSRGEPAELARAVLVGRPNVGKSSLFNALCGASAALVSQQPGTTRDYLTNRLDLEGMPCELIDTAGLQHEPDVRTIGAAAGRMTAEQQEQAQIELLCFDTTRPLDSWERERLATGPTAARLVLLTKCDVADEQAARSRRLVREEIARLGSAAQRDQIVETSSATGTGIAMTQSKLREAVQSIESQAGGCVVATAVRCRDSLRAAAEALDQARALANQRGVDELAAAEIRGALDALGRVVGAVYTDDILDRIFSRFCIGK